MAVIKRRPRLTLLAPRELPTGQPFDLQAIVECRKPVEVRSVDVILSGSSVYFTSSQYGRHRHATVALSASVRVFAGGVLEGRTVFPARLEIPAWAPGTYLGRSVRFEWAAAIRADIPWWPDAREVFDVHVRATGAPAKESGPLLVASSAVGPEGTRPYFELSLASRALVAGGRAEGAVSFAHTARNEYEGVEVRLVALETLLGFFTTTGEVTVARWLVAEGKPEENRPIRFALSLPREITPAFQHDKIKVDWELRARAKVSWNLDAKAAAPVEVAATADVARPAQAPPAVGSERLDLIWQHVAALTGFTFTEGALETRVGDATVRLWREHHGARGPALDGEVRVPDLGLGVKLGGKRGRPRLETRDPGQEEALARGLGVTLAACAPLAADDERVLCRRPGAGTRPEAVASFARALAALAKALVEARDALPSPVGVYAEPDAWREAAALLGGRLEPWRPAVTGEADGVGFVLAPEWRAAADPGDLRLEARPATPIDERRRLAWREGDALPGDRELAEACAGARSLTADGEAVTVLLPYATGALPAASRRLGRLVVLARALASPQVAGPYR